jgi:hypothetical protein
MPLVLLLEFQLEYDSLSDFSVMVMVFALQQVMHESPADDPNLSEC